MECAAGVGGGEGLTDCVDGDCCNWARVRLVKLVLKKEG